MTIHRIRLSTMQKIINVIAVSSGVVSLAVVGSGLYVYLQRDQLINNIKQQATAAVMDAVGGALPGAIGGSIPDTTGPALPGGSSPKSGGLGIPNM